MNINNYLDDRNLNREQRRALEKAHRMLIASYPERLTPVAENDPDIPYTSRPEARMAVWRNKQFTVQIWKYEHGIRISVFRNEWDSHTRRYKENITWDELMEIKRAVGYGEFAGFEVYPRDSEIINDANMRHIWINPDITQLIGE